MLHDCCYIPHDIIQNTVESTIRLRSTVTRYNSSGLLNQVLREKTNEVDAGLRRETVVQYLFF